MPLHRHYNRNLISNAGEKAFDQALEDLHDDPDRTWHACHSVRVGDHRTKKTVEHDFVLVTREGVITVEVKGGQVGMEGGQFVHLPDGRDHTRSRAFKEDPLHQAHGAAASLIDRFKEKQVLHTVVTPVVAFPQCAFHHADGEYRIIWSRSTPDSLGAFLLDILEVAKQRAPFGVKDLGPEAQKKLAKDLSPTLMPEQQAAQLAVGGELAARRQAENERILDGLSDNQRIMVQGPPGSGKSPYALRYMQRKAEAGQRGLYLCWNELLAARVKQLMTVAGLEEEVEVRPYYAHAQRLLDGAGMTGRLTYDTVNELPALLAEAFATMAANGTASHWDYIVADECQDLFHLGIDRVLDGCLGGDGVGHGHYLALYDLTYADEVDLTATYTRLLQHAAHYRLADHYRGTGGDGLNTFVQAVESGALDLERAYGADVTVVRYGRPEDVPRLAYTQYLTLCGGKADPERAVLLLHSKLLGERADDIHTVKDALASDARFEQLTPENLAHPAKGLRYTTMLKYKGLDKPLVILVLPPTITWGKKLYHQLLVGASRASVKLCVLAPSA